jgi:hypothetical protein
VWWHRQTKEYQCQIRDFGANGQVGANGPYCPPQTELKGLGGKEGMVSLPPRSLDKQSVRNYYVPPTTFNRKKAGEFSVIANVFAFVVPGYCAIHILRRGHATQNSAIVRSRHSLALDLQSGSELLPQ